MISLLGWLGALAFSLCTIPQTYQCYKQKHAIGVNPLFVFSWMSGGIATLIYIYHTIGIDLPIMLPILFGLVNYIIILRYIYFPRKIEYKHIPY